MTTGVQEVGGAGVLGVAFETTLNTYTAPTKWIPIRSESLNLVGEPIYRMNLRGKADRTGRVAGYQHVEGDVAFEVTSDILPYFLYAARTIPAKTGATAPFTYTFTPAHVAKTSTDPATKTARKTLSIYVARSQVPFSYLGCCVGQWALTLDNGLLICTASMVGIGEAGASSVASSFTANDPFGPGEITLEIPTASARSDSDTFSITVNDNATAANRLNGSRSAAYVTWGEREITASMEHDFSNDADFQTFVAVNEQAITLKAINSADDQVVVLLNAAVTDSYAVNLPGLGDLVRGTVSYHGVFETTAAYSVTVKTSEDLGGS